MTAFKSDFLNVLQSRGFVHQMLRFRGPRRARRHGPARPPMSATTAPRLHCISATICHHDAVLAAAERQQADHPDGRRHHHGRRPLRQGRDRGQYAFIEEIDANKDSIKWCFRQGSCASVPAPRRRHVGQRRMADETQLDRNAARYRPAFLGQPHAGDGFGAAPARARAGDEFHRVQLYGLPGL